MLCSYYISVIDELKAKNFDRSKSERQAKGKKGEITSLELDLAQVTVDFNVALRLS